MLNSWEYQGEFLSKYFKPEQSGVVANYFCNAVRGNFGFEQAATPEGVARSVGEEARRRLQDSSGTYDSQIEILRRLRAIISSSEALEFAAFILERENLPHTERARLKAEFNAARAKNVMSAQSPSEKQLAYLKSLGCSVVPQTKLEASELIDSILKKRKAA